MNCTTELQSIIAADCENPAVAGTFGKAYLIPHDAIDKTLSVVTKNVISSIVTKSGRKAYTYDSYDGSTTGNPTPVVGTYITRWQHDATLRIFVKTEAVKAFVNSIANSRFVLVMNNKEEGAVGEVKYEAYGWDAGLKLTAAVADTTMPDGVVYELTVGNDETSKESSLPKSVFDTDLATTETMLEALI